MLIKDERKGKRNIFNHRHLLVHLYSYLRVDEQVVISSDVHTSGKVFVVCILKHVHRLMFTDNACLILTSFLSCPLMA